MTKKEREAFTKGFYAGFRATGEGWNNEYPFEGEDITIDEQVNAALEEALKEAK